MASDGKAVRDACDTCAEAVRAVVDDVAPHRRMLALCANTVAGYQLAPRDLRELRVMLANGLVACDRGNWSLTGFGHLVLWHLT